MIIPTFHGTVERGVIRADVAYHKWLSTLEGKPVDIVVRPKRKQRSDNQNRYYWGIIIEMLSEFTGFDREEMHAALKEKFLGSDRDSRGLVRIKSTTALTTDEFVQYTNQIVIWAASSLSVYIPSPGEVDI